MTGGAMGGESLRPSGGKDCGGNCETCGGCGGGALYLTEGELSILRRFGEIPFWPVCRRSDEPICLEEGMDAASLSSLALKGLIRLDYDLPLSNFDYRPYANCPHHGSMALTALGQNAVEALEVQGVEE